MLSLQHLHELNADQVKSLDQRKYDIFYDSDILQLSFIIYRFRVCATAEVGSNVIDVIQLRN